MLKIEDLKNAKIIPDPLKDQFFLTDERVIREIVQFADLRSNDVVLEIGAGGGNLTRQLAKKVGRVIAFEIDERFRPFLSKLPKNVEVHYEDAWNYVQMHGKWHKKKIYNKVVSNLPYSFIEQFLHNLTFLDYDKVILLIPTKAVSMIKENGIFASFFSPEILLYIPKEKFYPAPNTNSALINLVKLPDPIETKNLGRYLRQRRYQHEDQLVKNSLMEGLITYQRIVFGKNMTKNEARGKIAGKNIPKNLLEQHPNNKEIYEIVEQKFNL